MAQKRATMPQDELSLENVSQALSKEKPLLGRTVAFATMLQWGADGIPRVVGTPVRMAASPAEKLMETMKACLDLPYDGNDPSLQNLTMAEAMVIQEARKAAHGDSYAFGRIMDRIVGPPVQKSQSVNVNADLSDFLDKVAEQSKEVVIDITAEKPNMDDL